MSERAAVCLAVRALRSGRPDLSRVLLSALSARLPGESYVWLARSVAELECGDGPAAAVSAAEAVRLDPRCDAARAQLVEALLRLDDLDGADRALGGRGAGCPRLSALERAVARRRAS